MELQPISPAHVGPTLPEPVHRRTSHHHSRIASTVPHSDLSAADGDVAHVRASPAYQHRLNDKVKVVSRSLSSCLGINALQSWWRYHIDPLLIVQDSTGHMVHDPRDFLALERTHLAYIRTCNALALFAVLTAQVFVLKGVDSDHGRWLSASAYIVAAVLAIVSGLRTIWMQNRLLVARTSTVFWLFAILSITVLALILLVTIFNMRS